MSDAIVPEGTQTIGRQYDAPLFLPSPGRRFSPRVRKEGGWCILAASLQTIEGSEPHRRLATRSPHPSMPSPSDILLEHLPLVERAIRSVCRGKMDRTQIEDFTGYVHVRLVENDYAIIRAFAGRSSFGTYLTSVVAHLLTDYRNHEWGKWHASTEAKNIGPMAEEFERLTVRDGRTMDDVLVILRTKFPAVTEKDLERIAARLPKRHRRKMVSLDERPEPQVQPDDGEALSQNRTAALISQVVRAFIERLPKSDQLLFQLRFEAAMPVPQIAKALRQDAQALYRRLRVHFTALRKDLEKAGIRAEDVAKLIGSDDAILDFHLKSVDDCPSNDEGSGSAPEGKA